MVAAIEAPFAFLEEQKKAVLRDAVKSPQMAFGLVPKVLNSIDMALPGNKMIGMVNPNMAKTRHIQCVVARKAVRINNAVWLSLEGQYQ